MTAIEFLAPTGKSFSVQLYDKQTNATIGSPIAATEGAPTRYRADTGTNTGIVFVVATATNLRVAGYANLNDPSAAGYSPIVDNLNDADLLKIKALVDNSKVVVLPGRDRALPKSNRGRIVVSQGELITIVRAVVDGNGNPLSLAGRTLQFVIQDARGLDVAVVPNSSITVSGASSDSYSFVVPSAGSARVGNFVYALNDIGSSKAELTKGDWIVESRPLADS